MSSQETPLPGVSIIIPAWNEESRLGKTLERFLPSLEARGDPFEVIVVADGILDGTARLAREYGNRKVRVLEFQEKLGKGGAILAGLREARHEYVGYLDADGPIPPSEMLLMVDALRECDGIVASRWVRGSRIVRKEPFVNMIAGRAWNAMVRSLLFLPVSDTQCGAKFFRKSVIESSLRAIALTNRAFDVDLLYHIRKNGFALKEVPVTWTHDPDSRMPIIAAMPVMFLSLLGVRMMNLPFSNRVPAVLIEWFRESFGSV